MIIFKYILFYITLGIILSIDAFMACMAYGLSHQKKYFLILTPLAVGTCHILFPMLAITLYNQLHVDNYGIGKYLSSTIFVFLGLANLSKENSQKANPIFSLIGVLLLATAVSIDSFFVGISICIHKYSLIGCFIFGIVSFLSTILSLSLAKFLYQKVNIDFDIIVGLLFTIFGILIFFDIF